MPAGIPVATVALNGAANAAILAAQMIATGDTDMLKKIIDYKEKLKSKVIKANQELSKIKLSLTIYLFVVEVIIFKTL